MKIGNAIKLIRKQLDITQIELSEMTGISQTSLSKIEGGSKPSEANLKKICDALEVPPSVLYMLAMEDTDVPASKKNKYKLLFPAIMNLAMEIVGENNKKLIRSVKD
jgi:transcriptional regulator with XRE-family HTH domain